MSRPAGPSDPGAYQVPVIAIGAAAALICYELLTHWAVVTAQHSALGLLFAITPLLLVTAALLWRARRRTALVVSVLAVIAISVVAFGRASAALRMLYPFPSVLVYGFLLILFGRTLIPGREPLITRLARRVHGPLPDEIVAYTRRLTWVWCLVFAAMAATSILLFTCASLETWSMFANLLNLPLVAIVFVAEYVYRVARFPGFPHVSVLTAVKAFRDFGREGASSARRS